LEISPISDPEVAEVVALWERCGLTRPWNDPVADIALARSRPTSDVLAGRLGGRIIASAMVGTDGHRGWVYYLSVDPEHQRQGLGRQMMEACEAWTRGRGVPKIMLLVRGSNTATIGFYRALGYLLEDTVLLGKRFDGKSWTVAPGQG
jgi:ribosomal protein S18 acetylase RimI-like enzyme